MEEHGPKKPLDRICACPELAVATPSALNAIPFVPSKPTSVGSSTASTSTSSVTRSKWEQLE